MTETGQLRDRGSIEYDLASSDEEVRRLAVERLSTLAEDDALPLLASSLGDESWRVRKAAVARMVQLQDCAASVALLVDALADGENSGRRGAAVEALVQRGGRALPHLVASLDTEDADVRKQLVDVIAGIGDGSAAAAMLRALEDSDPNVSAAAADALGILGGPGAAEALERIGLDTSFDPLIRVSSLRALARLEVTIPAALLDPLLEDSMLRPAVYRVLANGSDAAAVEALLKGLTLRAKSARSAAIAGLVGVVGRVDGDDAVRLVARIREVAASDDAVIDTAVAGLDGSDLAERIVLIQFLSLLGDSRAAVALLDTTRDEALRTMAHDALGALGDAGESAIDAAWEGLDAMLHLEACAFLGRGCGAAGVRRLLHLLEEGDAALRTAAADALGERRCTEAVPALVRRLESASDEDEEGVDETSSLVDALIAIGCQEDAGEQIATELRGRLEGAAESLRHSIACVLGSLGLPDEATTVAQLLKDPSPRVRRAAVEGLADLLGEEDPEPLRLALADESPSVRVAAANALGRSNGERVLEDLERLALDEDLRVRAAGLHALGELGSRREELRDAALARLEMAPRDEPVVVIACIEALGAIGGLTAAKAALRLLDHESIDIVLTAVACIGMHGDEEALASLLELVSHPDWSVRASVIQTLTDRRQVRAIPSILRRLETEGDAFVRETILAAMRRLEG